jgi:hypothetical protein
MIWTYLVTNPLVRKFGIYALIALILVASVATWKIQVAALRAERDAANQKIGTLETESKQLRSALEMAKLQQEAATKAQENRVIEQGQIEVKKHESTKQNAIILQKPDNKPLADTRLTDDMLGILRQ